MARSTSWIILCLVVALAGACAGPRPGGGCAPACDPAPEVCSLEPTPDPCPDRPPNAKPGEAWCRVWIPPETKTVTEKVLVTPASTEQIRIPAESCTRPRLVCIAPGRVVETVKPAVWTKTTRQVCVRGPVESFKRVCCGCEDKSKCQCYVKQECGPVWRTEEVPVCIEPSKKCVKYIPAQYKLVEERYELNPARCEKRCIAATYETRTREVCCKPGKWVWRRNDACDVPEETLPALEVEMVDSDAAGNKEGVFEEGETVRYDLTVRSDVGSEAFPTIRVVFNLPPELEFISGTGRGVSIEGAGKSAESSSFQLSLEEEVKMHILAKVVAVPEGDLVQTSASILNEAGEELAIETESTTLTVKGGK